MRSYEKSNPDGLLVTAKDKQEHYKTSQEDEPDKIFIVSDIDHFKNDLAEHILPFIDLEIKQTIDERNQKNYRI